MWTWISRRGIGDAQLQRRCTKERTFFEECASRVKHLVVVHREYDDRRAANSRPGKTTGRRENMSLGHSAAASPTS
jgi:hypothetical protein